MGSEQVCVCVFIMKWEIRRANKGSLPLDGILAVSVDVNETDVSSLCHSRGKGQDGTRALADEPIGGPLPRIPRSRDSIAGRKLQEMPAERGPSNKSCRLGLGAIVLRPLGPHAIRWFTMAFHMEEIAVEMATAQRVHCAKG